MIKQYRLTLIFTLVFLGLIVSLMACNKKHPTHKQPAASTYTVTVKPFAKKLSFSSTIEPSEITVVTSPITGLIKQSYFKYGQQIRENQLLLTLSSTKTSESYMTLVLNFLKAKEKHQEKNVKFLGAQALWEKGAISKNEYIDAKDAREEAYVNRLQAKHSLEKITKLTHSDLSAITKLNLSDTKAVRRIIEKERPIKLYAPKSGIALPAEPPNSQDKPADNHAAGSKVEEGQALLTIGDISGFSLKIYVDEININQIKVGLPVTVTGEAFPDYTLKGIVKNVGIHHVKTTSSPSSHLALFPVQIAVQSLTPAQQQAIHIGMSAKITIHLPSHSHIMIPIRAIEQQGNHTTVTVIDKKTGRLRSAPVVTGETTQDEVVIRSGLAPGDHIQVKQND